MESSDTLSVIAVAAAVIAAAVFIYAWIRLRRGEAPDMLPQAGTESTSAPGGRGMAVRGRSARWEDPRITVQPCADAAAPGDFLVHGLNASGYAPVGAVIGRPGHFIVVVARFVNHSREEVIVQRPQIVFRLDAGATKLEPPATLAAFGRVSLYDARASTARPLDRLQEEIQRRMVEGYSLNRSAIELKPFEPVLSYAVFLPGRLSGLPVFDEDLLNFGLGFFVSGNWRTYDGFHAQPFRGLAVTYYS